jgi:hypothetical protein
MTLGSILQAGKQFIVDKDWKAFSRTVEGKFDIQRQVRSKILAIYYPEDFLYSVMRRQIIF